MKIEIKDSEYIKLNLSQEGRLDVDSWEQLQNLECILPFSKVYNEDNNVGYQIGKRISLVEYLNMKELNFQETRGLLLSFVNGFEQVELAGGKSFNIMEDLHQVYINPVTQELRFLYVPVELELYAGNFKKMLRELLFLMRTTDSEMLLGMVADMIGTVTATQGEMVSALKERLLKTTSNIKVVEKEVEVDRVVEKIIERPVINKNDGIKRLLFYTTLYTINMVLMPMLLSHFLSSGLLAKPQLLNFLLWFLTILISMIVEFTRETSEKNDKTIVTLQPQENDKNK